MAARKKKKKAAKRQPALVGQLDRSGKRIEAAVGQGRRANRQRALAGFGGIGAIFTALREFCKNWPKIKAALKKAIAFLRKNGQKELAKILEAIVKFLDKLALVCRIIPGV